MFLFSAPTGNRATHAGYDTSILAELLGCWRDWLEREGPGDSESVSTNKFEPYVAMTDTDAKERSALTAIWPQIILLLCRFHLRQCWTNKIKATVGHVKDDLVWKAHLEANLSVLQQLYVR